MDDVGLDRELHERALDALGRVNRVSLTAVRAWWEVERLWRAGVQPVRVLDVACGGGDVLMDLEGRALRGGVAVELTGCDMSATALARARASADALAAHRREGHGPVAALRFERRDVLSAPLPTESDVVLCSLFLHHLSNEDAVALLRAMARACQSVVLVQDLRRTRRGYALAWIGLHTLTRSPVARQDGMASVRAAYTLAEARELAEAAGLSGAEVRPCWPQRFTLRWARSPAHRADPA
jgi:2-polyprenyl-3-methyl-5-hydroxy-6-metoxy-1,4-benzoquinol methylase